MDRRPIADLADLAAVVTQDELPVPARVEWYPTSGLRVQVQPHEVDAWLKVAHGTKETAKAATELRMGGFVFYTLPRLIDSLPVTLAWHVEVDEDAWRMSNTSSLAYEEAVTWLADWRSGDWTDEQRQAAWFEARDKYGVPASCLPELVDDEMADV